MHAAPPVRMSLEPDPAWSVFVVVCAACAAANVAAWVALLLQAPVAMAAALALLAAGLAARWAWRAARRGAAMRSTLHWDGVVWGWAPDPLPPADGTLRVMIDLGAWVLLRFVPDTAPRRVAWLAVSRRQGGLLWPSWRAALFSHRPDTAPSAVGEPS